MSGREQGVVDGRDGLSRRWKRIETAMVEVSRIEATIQRLVGGRGARALTRLGLRRIHPVLPLLIEDIARIRLDIEAMKADYAVAVTGRS